MEYQIIGKKVIFNEFFKIEKAIVSWKRSNGEMGKGVTRYVIRRGDSVGIIPLCSDGIVLVKQFRYPAAREGVNPYLWEIPAGMVDRGESPDITARRELKEEIGVESEKIIPLISFFLSPGALDEMFHLFYALVDKCGDVNQIGGVEEEEEDLEVKKFNRVEIMEMIQNGEIIDSKTIASLMYYFLKFPE